MTERPQRKVGPGGRPLTEKELAMIRTQRDRQERYIRTAHIVQSKWFMVGGSVAIAAFLIIIFLLAR